MSVTSQPERPRILLVDDEEVLLRSICGRLGKLRPDHDFLPFADAKAALCEISDSPVDLLVTDIRMPGMNGVELILAARKVARSLPVIVMTGYPTADLQMDATVRRSIEYIQKPFEIERLVSLIDAALAPQRPGFSGAISVQTLPDIVQLYALSCATGALRVSRRSDEGQIWFEHGAITHASTGDLTGEEAFHCILLWRGGHFSMAPGDVAPARSIRAGTTELLMESCKRLDDQRRRAEAQGPVSAPGWDFNPPVEPAAPEPAQTERLVVDAAPVALAQPAAIAVKSQLDAALAPRESMERTHMANAKESLAKLDNLDGFLGAALVDSESGMLLASEGGGAMLNIEVAGASNTEVVRAKRRAIKNLGLKDEVEDILISLNKQYHLIRPLRAKPTLFFYLALERSRANLALARITLAEVERELQA